MAHDWKRCKALAADLVLATRDMGCDPDIIATHNITDAFGHVAQTLLGMGIPAPTVTGALRYCAECVDAVARDDAEQKASARRPRLVLVHDRDEDTP
jgi:hypothetical protein